MGAAQKATGAFGSTIDTAVIAGAGLASVGKRMFNVPGVMQAAGQIQNIAEDFKITTTNTEAWGVMASKATSQVLTGLNLTDKQMQRAKSTISSVAFDMNTDVGTVAQSFKALQQAGVDVTKIGFKSFGEFQKFMSITGTDAKQFAFTIGKMRSQFRMSDKDIKDTLTTVVALGKRFNMGAEATQLMANTVGVLADEGASLWAELGPAKTKKFLEGTQALSIAFMNAGNSAEDAQKLALGVGRAMIKGRAGVQQLYAGLAEELPDAMQTLTENFGDVNTAFKMLQEDPAKFTKTIAIVAKKIRDSSKSPQEAQEKLSRFSHQMAVSFGPEFSSLIGGSLDKTVQSFSAVDKELGRPGGLSDKNGVITKMANNFQDGRTMTERLMWAQDRFRTKLKTLMKETDQDFLKRFNHSADVTSVKLKELASRDGLLGKATSLFVEFSNHGLGGVASKISKDYGPAMAMLIQQFGPILQQLPMIATAFMGLLSPMTIIVGGIAALVLYFKEASEGGGKFKDVVDSILPKIGDIAGKVFDTLVKIAPIIGNAIATAWRRIDWSKVEDAMAWVAHGIVDLIPPLIQAIWHLMVGMAKGIVEGIVDIFKDGFGAAKDWIANSWVGDVAGSVRDGVSSAWDSTVDFLGFGAKKVSVDLSDMMIKAVNGVRPTILKTQEEVWQDLLRMVASNTDMFKADVKGLTVDVVGAVKTTTDQISGMLSTALSGIGKAKAEGKGAAALAGAAKDLGIDTGEAAELIKAVSGMSPAEIQKRVGSIKNTYIGFLKDVTLEGQKQLNESRKFFDKFMEQQKTFWASEAAGVIGMFTNAAQTLLTNFWNTIIKQAEVRSQELIATLNKVLFGINTAGALGSPVGPDGKPMATALPSSSGVGGSTAPSFDNLIAHINRPAWSTEMLEEMKKEHEENKKQMNMLIEVSAIGKTKPLRRSDLMQVGQNLGIGE